MDIQSINLGQLSTAVLFIVGFIGGMKYLKKELEEALKGMLKTQLSDINTKLDAVQASIASVDTQTCKNFLTRYLADIERGVHICDDERRRFWEEYDHYTDDLDENSYIKEWVEELKENGKLKR